MNLAWWLGMQPKSALELRQATQPFPNMCNLLAPVSHLVVPAARCPKSAHDVPPQSSTMVSKHGGRKMVETTVFMCYNLWQPIICINPAMIQISGGKKTPEHVPNLFLVAARISCKFSGAGFLSSTVSWNQRGAGWCSSSSMKMKCGGILTLQQRKYTWRSR